MINSTAIAEFIRDQDREHDGFLKLAKGLAFLEFGGRTGKVERFMEALERMKLVCVEVTMVSVSTDTQDVNLFFIGDEAATLQAVRSLQMPERKPLSETILVKMLSNRMIEVCKGLLQHNTQELGMQERTASGPSPHKAELLSEVILEDFPECRRFMNRWIKKQIENDRIPERSASYDFAGDAIVQIRKIMRKPECTRKVMRMAWDVVEVFKVMHS